jgi:hypothetical protein
VAAGGLALVVENDTVRVEFGTSDWFGPGRFTVAGRGQTFVSVEDGMPELVDHRQQ